MLKPKHEAFITKRKQKQFTKEGQLKEALKTKSIVVKLYN